MACESIGRGFLIAILLIPVHKNAKIKNKSEKIPKIPIVPNQEYIAEAPLLKEVAQKIVWLIPSGL